MRGWGVGVGRGAVAHACDPSTQFKDSLVYNERTCLKQVKIKQCYHVLSRDTQYLEFNHQKSPIAALLHEGLSGTQRHGSFVNGAGRPA